MSAYQVRDGASRLITFEGQLLGHISSQRENNPRWTEMTVYKTAGGTYILEKVGRSVVTHMPGCPEIKGKYPRFQEAHPGDDPDDGYEYHSCVPEHYDFTRLLVEEDRYWAMDATDPVRVADAMYRKHDGERHLPRMGLDLLGLVTKADPTFGDFWQVEHIS